MSTQEQAEFYSRRMGQTTIETETHNRSVSSRREHHFTSDSESEGQSTGYAPRRLRLADELVHTEEEDELIVLPPKSRPLLLTAIPAYQDEQLTARRALTYHAPERADTAPPVISWTEPKQSAPQPEQEAAPPRWNLHL